MPRLWLALGTALALTACTQPPSHDMTEDQKQALKVWATCTFLFTTKYTKETQEPATSVATASLVGCIEPQNAFFKTLDNPNDPTAQAQARAAMFQNAVALSVKLRAAPPRPTAPTPTLRSGAARSQRAPQTQIT